MSSKHLLAISVLVALALLAPTAPGLCAPPTPSGCPTCSIEPLDPGRTIPCGDTATFCGAVTPPGGPDTYQWTITGGVLITSSASSCVTVRAGSGSDFTLTLITTRDGCSSTCSRTVSVTAPTCEIVPFSSRILSCGDTTSYCARITPPGGTVTYQWSITGGTILSSPTAPCVNVRAGTGGSFTLRLEALRNGCSLECEAPIVTSFPMCDVVPLDPGRTLACGDTATFCGSITPSGGATTFSWSVIGGTILSSPSASCVLVRVGIGGGLRVILDATRNGCATHCEQVEGPSSPTCEILPVNPSRAMFCGDTATFFSHVTPSSGSIVYQWTIAGATILSDPSNPYVLVRAGTGTEFTLNLQVERSGCPTECALTVPLAVPKCMIQALDPSRTLGCRDTATYCVQVNPPNGTTSHEWRISGGTLVTSPSEACVTVQSGDGTQFTLQVTVMRNGCVTTCELDVATDCPTPVLLSLIEARAAVDAVHLRWLSHGPYLEATIQRRTTDTPWLALAAVAPDGMGILAYSDRAVRAGGRYGYRLVTRDEDGQHLSPEAWVTVPSLQALALRGLGPNPADRKLAVSFSLPTNAPAVIEVLDLGGRQLLVENIHEGSGTRVLDVRSVPPGLYVIRLSRERVGLPEDLHRAMKRDRG